MVLEQDNELSSAKLSIKSKEQGRKYTSAER